jgi:antigen flippase
VLATLTFAPLVIALLYSAKLGAAVGVLRWVCLGTMLQVITWPMGLIIVAKGKQGVFFFAELAWAVVAASLAWICIKSYGLNGAGIALFGSYVFHGCLTYPNVHHLSEFRWSKENKQKGLTFLSVIGLVCSGFYVLPLLWAAGIGTLATVASGFYSIRVFLKIVSFDELPLNVQRVLTFFRSSAVASVTPR